jgi:hypothetical protein
VALAALTQCEKQWQAVHTCFDEKYETLVADHPDAETEIDMVQAALVQIGHCVQNFL